MWYNSREFAKNVSGILFRGVREGKGRGRERGEEGERGGRKEKGRGGACPTTQKIVPVFLTVCV